MSRAAPRAWQRMLSGRRLDLLDPSPLDVEIEDIAGEALYDDFIEGDGIVLVIARMDTDGEEGVFTDGMGHIWVHVAPIIEEKAFRSEIDREKRKSAVMVVGDRAQERAVSAEDDDAGRERSGEDIPVHRVDVVAEILPCEVGPRIVDDLEMLGSFLCFHGGKEE